MFPHRKSGVTRCTRDASCAYVSYPKLRKRVCFLDFEYSKRNPYTHTLSTLFRSFHFANNLRMGVASAGDIDSLILTPLPLTFLYYLRGFLFLHVSLFLNFNLKECLYKISKEFSSSNRITMLQMRMLFR